MKLGLVNRLRARVAAAAPMLAVLLLGCPLVTGCAHRPSAGELRGAKYEIRKMKFEGAERFSNKQIYKHLEMRPRQWLPPQRHWYYEGLIPADAEHIVELYHAYGYYEAKVVDVRVEHLDRKLRDKVDLTFVIEEGPVTKVEEVVVRWPEGSPPGPPRSKRHSPFERAPILDPERISSKVEVEPGDPFEIPALNQSVEVLRDHLHRAGHPHAEVVEHAEVDREARTARVEFEVRPGPFMTIGSISITGLETVPEKLVHNEVDYAIGKPYSPALLEQLERHAYELRVFSSASVTVEDEDGEADGGAEQAEVGNVDLTLDLREGDPQRVRLGVGLGFEPNRWDQRFSAQYTHDNLFHQLYRLRLTGRAGYAELPHLFNPKAHGPIAELELQLEKKGLLEKHLVWTGQPGLELGIEQGYQFWSAENRFGVSRFFTRWFQLRVSHTLRYVDFFSVSPQLRALDTFLGLDFRDPYVLSYITLGATVYAVDSITSPNDGAVLGVDYRVAGGPFGGDYDYQELAPVLRGYWRPIERLQFAARARLGMIFALGGPWSEDPSAPIDMRRYLGGSDTVRGWGLRRLAPRITDCAPTEQSTVYECQSIPIGGNTSVLGNFEVRVRTWRQLWVAGFVDGGDVQAGVARFVPREWNYSAGGGLRYDSPIGKFRLDVGFRLNDTPLSEGEPIWALHLGLGESF